MGYNAVEQTTHRIITSYSNPYVFALTNVISCACTEKPDTHSMYKSDTESKLTNVEFRTLLLQCNATGGERPRKKG